MVYRHLCDRNDSSYGIQKKKKIHSVKRNEQNMRRI